MVLADAQRSWSYLSTWTRLHLQSGWVAARLSKPAAIDHQPPSEAPEPKWPPEIRSEAACRGRTRPRAVTGIARGAGGCTRHASAHDTRRGRESALRPVYSAPGTPSRDLTSRLTSPSAAEPAAPACASTTAASTSAARASGACRARRRSSVSEEVCACRVITLCEFQVAASLSGAPGYARWWARQRCFSGTP